MRALKSHSPGECDSLLRTADGFLGDGCGFWVMVLGVMGFGVMGFGVMGLGVSLGVMV